MERKNFDVQVKEMTDHVTVYLRGELDLAVAAQFRAVVEPLIPIKKQVILNLENLTYIDSTGMGIIIFLLKARNGEGNKFAVENIPANIKKLFDLTGITKFLPIHDPTSDPTMRENL
ncbi:MAG: STAS domain-containing protein [Gorillibacterium sp.]|nr:STAS domain-containing protein [Gorillibacterium sp.]